MKAFVSSFNVSLDSWQVQCKNDIAVAFAIEDGTKLRLNEELEVDLPNLIKVQRMRRLTTGQDIKVRLRDCDIHDLRIPSGHGTSRTPSIERLSAA
jgi:hypothetical protein